MLNLSTYRVNAFGVRKICVGFVALTVGILLIVSGDVSRAGSYSKYFMSATHLLESDETAKMDGCFGSHNGSDYVESNFSPLNFTPTQQLSLEHLERVIDIVSKSLPEKVHFSIDQEAPSFNGYAFMRGVERHVKLNLGLLLNKLVTQDVLALVVCHEVGHHFGGEPRELSPALSFEGQADFVAPQECFQNWVKLSTTEFLSEPKYENAVVLRYCALNHLTRDLCYRTIEAAQRLTSIFAKFKKIELPAIFGEEKTLVQSTLKGHGSAQCRLDSIKKGFEFSMSYPWQKKRELRPRCWFLPSKF